MDVQEQDCSWDQRIPNEPLCQRQFDDGGNRPPVIPQGGARSTSHCTRRQPFLLMDRAVEEKAMIHWLSLNGSAAKSNTKPTLKEMMRRYPNRPWLHGIHRNINVDSELSPRNIKHCATSPYLPPLVSRRWNRPLAPERHRLIPMTCLNLWNQPTSVRMTAPYYQLTPIGERHCISQSR